MCFIISIYLKKKYPYAYFAAQQTPPLKKVIRDYETDALGISKNFFICSSNIFGRG